jgi:hypothetical protein
MKVLKKEVRKHKGILKRPGRFEERLKRILRYWKRLFEVEVPGN